MSDVRARAPLQPQDLALTIFGAYGRQPAVTVWSGGMVEILGQLGFSTEAARAALARLATRGLLERHRNGRRISYTLSPRAEELMAEGDRRIFSFGRAEPSSDLCTVLWHAIPESRRVERSRFATRLRFLGFGSLQDATWVAASDREQDVLALLRELDIEAYASILVGRLSRGLPPAPLIAQAWDLEAVSQGYDTFIAEFGRYQAPAGRRGLTPQRAFVVRTLMLHRFRGFPFADPELPESIADGHALRSRAVATFDDVYAALAGPAQRYFRQVAQPGPGARR